MIESEKVLERKLCKKMEIFSKMIRDYKIKFETK
jgi:hypothetical protein